MATAEPQDTLERVQLHLTLSYRLKLPTHPAVRDYLARGWRVAQLSRLTDREVLVTFERTAAAAVEASRRP